MLSSILKALSRKGGAMNEDNSNFDDDKNGPSSSKSNDNAVNMNLAAITHHEIGFRYQGKIISDMKLNDIKDALRALNVKPVGKRKHELAEELSKVISTLKPDAQLNMLTKTSSKRHSTEGMSPEDKVTQASVESKTPSRSSSKRLRTSDSNDVTPASIIQKRAYTTRAMTSEPRSSTGRLLRTMNRYNPQQPVTSEGEKSSKKSSKPFGKIANQRKSLSDKSTAFTKKDRASILKKNKSGADDKIASSSGQSNAISTTVAADGASASGEKSESSPSTRHFGARDKFDRLRNMKLSSESRVNAWAMSSISSKQDLQGPSLGSPAAGEDEWGDNLMDDGDAYLDPDGLDGDNEEDDEDELAEDDEIDEGLTRGIGQRDAEYEDLYGEDDDDIDEEFADADDGTDQGFHDKDYQEGEPYEDKDAESEKAVEVVDLVDSEEEEATVDTRGPVADTMKVPEAAVTPVSSALTQFGNIQKNEAGNTQLPSSQLAAALNPAADPVTFLESLRGKLSPEEYANLLLYCKRDVFLASAPISIPVSSRSSDSNYASSLPVPVAGISTTALGATSTDAMKPSRLSSDGGLWSSRESFLPSPSVPTPSAKMHVENIYGSASSSTTAPSASEENTLVMNSRRESPFQMPSMDAILGMGSQTLPSIHVNSGIHVKKRGLEESTLWSSSVAGYRVPPEDQVRKRQSLGPGSDSRFFGASLNSSFSLGSGFLPQHRSTQQAQHKHAFALPRRLAGTAPTPYISGLPPSFARSSTLLAQPTAQSSLTRRRQTMSFMQRHKYEEKRQQQDQLFLRQAVPAPAVTSTNGSSSAPGSAAAIVAKRILEGLAELSTITEQERKRPVAIPLRRILGPSSSPPSVRAAEPASQSVAGTNTPPWPISGDSKRIANSEASAKTSTAHVSFSRHQLSAKPPVEAQFMAAPTAAPTAASVLPVQSEDSEFVFEAPTTVAGLADIDYEEERETGGLATPGLSVSIPKFVFSPPGSSKSLRARKSIASAPCTILKVPKLAPEELESTVAKPKVVSFAKNEEHSAPPLNAVSIWASAMNSDNVKCPACRVPNKKDAATCVSCESDLRLKASISTSSITGDSAAIISDSLWAKAAASAADTVKCPACMVPNSKSVSKCVSCETFLGPSAAGGGANQLPATVPPPFVFGAASSNSALTQPIPVLAALKSMSTGFSINPNVSSATSTILTPAVVPNSSVSSSVSATTAGFTFSSPALELQRSAAVPFGAEVGGSKDEVVEKVPGPFSVHPTGPFTLNDNVGLKSDETADTRPKKRSLQSDDDATTSTLAKSSTKSSGLNFNAKPFVFGAKENTLSAPASSTALGVTAPYLFGQPSNSISSSLPTFAFGAPTSKDASSSSLSTVSMAPAIGGPVAFTFSASKASIEGAPSGSVSSFRQKDFPTSSGGVIMKESSGSGLPDKDNISAPSFGLSSSSTTPAFGSAVSFALNKPASVSEDKDMPAFAFGRKDTTSNVSTSAPFIFGAKSESTAASAPGPAPFLFGQASSAPSSVTGSSAKSSLAPATSQPFSFGSASSYSAVGLNNVSSSSTTGVFMFGQTKDTSSVGSTAATVGGSSGDNASNFTFGAKPPSLVLSGNLSSFPLLPVSQSSAEHSVAGTSSPGSSMDTTPRSDTAVGPSFSSTTITSGPFGSLASAPSNAPFSSGPSAGGTAGIAFSQSLTSAPSQSGGVSSDQTQSSFGRPAPFSFGASSVPPVTPTVTGGGVFGGFAVPASTSQVSSAGLFSFTGTSTMTGPFGLGVAQASGLGLGGSMNPTSSLPFTGGFSAGAGDNKQQIGARKKVRAKRP